MYWTRTLDHVWYTAGEEGGREGREGGRQGEIARGREEGRGGDGEGEGEREKNRERERKEREVWREGLRDSYTHMWLFYLHYSLVLVLVGLVHFVLLTLVLNELVNYMYMYSK